MHTSFMTIQFIINTPCNFSIDSDLDDIIPDIIDNYMSALPPIELSSSMGTFSTDVRNSKYRQVSVNDHYNDIIKIDFEFGYSGEYGDDEDAFVKANYAVFSEFVDKIAESISEALKSDYLFGLLPDANVVIQDKHLYVEVYDGQKSLHLDWSSPVITCDDYLDSILSDLPYN